MIEMKTKGVLRLVLPSLLVIDGILYKPTVVPLGRDILTNAESVQKQIILEDVCSLDETE